MLWAALSCAVAVTLFLSPALLTGRYLSPADMLYDAYPWQSHQPPNWSGSSNGLLGDSVLQFEPWLEYGAHRLRAGELPLWNPDNMLGAPFLGNMQSALFSPLNWIYFLLPGGGTLVVIAWLKLFVASMGTYLLARQVARVGALGASIAAITFTFGASLTVWLHAALAGVAVWLPWLWWGTARLLEQPSPRRLVALAGMVALSLVAGHPETAFQCALASGLLALFEAWETARRQKGAGSYATIGLSLRLSARRAILLMGPWVAAYLLGALVASVQLIPFIEYAWQGTTLLYRSGPGFRGGWLPFPYAWTMVSPDLFGNAAHDTWWGVGTNYNESNNYNGVLPLLLAPFALLAQHQLQRRLAIFLSALAVLMMAVVYHAPVIYQAVTMLPIMAVVQNQRLVLVVQLALALLASLGVSAFITRLKEGMRVSGWLAMVALWWLIIGVAFPLAFGRSYFGIPANSSRATQVWEPGLLRAALLISVGVGLLLVVAWLWKLRHRVALAALVMLPLLLLADLWQAHGDYNPTVSPAYYFPPTEATSFLQGQVAPFRSVAAGWMFMPNTNLHYGTADLRGYDAIEPRSYRELTFQIDPTIRRSAEGGFRPFHSVQSHLLDLLNVRYVMSAPGEDPNPQYSEDIAQDLNTGGLVKEIIGDNKPGQTFVAQKDNITQIQVFGANYGRQAAGHLIFHLKAEPSAPEDLVRQELDAAELKDDSYWVINFPPVHSTRGQRFYFYFESSDARHSSAVTLWYSAGDPYPGGHRTVDGQGADGDLVFRVLSAPDPEDPWLVRVLDGGADGASVYENRRALPRAWLTHQVEVEPNADARLYRIGDPSFDAARTVMMSERLPPEMVLPAVPPPIGSDQVEIINYKPERVDVVTQSSKAGLLVLADQAYPGWRASVDGQSAVILTADHALRAVYVPQGHHTVQFEYNPRSVLLGAVLTGLGLILIVLTTLARPRGRVESNKEGSDTAIPSLIRNSSRRSSWGLVNEPFCDLWAKRKLKKQ